MDRISSGEWPPGSPIPHETHLAEEFGVTRPTINRAMRELADAGLIVRKRKAGSRVAIHRTPSAMVRLPIVREAIEARGGRHRYELLDRAVTAPPEPVRLGFALSPGQPALYLRGRHFENDRPYQLETRWINLALLPEAASRDFTRTSANEWLVRRIPYTRVEHEFSAARATDDTPGLLDIEDGAPVFIIDRRTWSGENPVTRARMVHPGEHFRMVARDDLG